MRRIYKENSSRSQHSENVMDIGQAEPIALMESQSDYKRQKKYPLSITPPFINMYRQYSSNIFKSQNTKMKCFFKKEERDEPVGNK